jgi:hypothetical protein
MTFMNDYRINPLEAPLTALEGPSRAINACIVECHINRVPIPVVVAVEFISEHSEVLVDYSAEYWECERPIDIQRKKSAHKDIEIQGKDIEIQELKQEVKLLRRPQSNTADSSGCMSELKRQITVLTDGIGFDRWAVLQESLGCTVEAAGGIKRRRKRDSEEVSQEKEKKDITTQEKRERERRSSRAAVEATVSHVVKSQDVVVQR